jgi:hypothetical protein
LRCLTPLAPVALSPKVLGESIGTFKPIVASCACNGDSNMDDGSHAFKAVMAGAVK